MPLFHPPNRNPDNAQGYVMLSLPPSSKQAAPTQEAPPQLNLSRPAMAWKTRQASVLEDMLTEFEDTGEHFRRLSILPGRNTTSVFVDPAHESHRVDKRATLPSLKDIKERCTRHLKK